MNQTLKQVDATNYFPGRDPDEVVSVRYDILWMMDILKGNPQGDPDDGNAPRADADGNLLITDAGAKRCIRDYVSATRTGDPRYGIWVERGAVLEDNIAKARKEAGLPEWKRGKGKGKGNGKTSREDVILTRERMLKTNWDFKMFGGVASIGANAGTVRGAVQVFMSTSYHSAEVRDLPMVRVATSDNERSEIQGGLNQDMGANRRYVDYGLFPIWSYVSPFEAKRNGVTYGDLNLYVESMIYGPPEFWSGISRGRRETRGLILFEHDGPLGLASPDLLRRLVKAELRNPEAEEPRSWDDYVVQVEEPPRGVRAIIVVDPTTARK